MEPFIGQLMLVGFNFAPRGWAFCNGQLMSIAQNPALFSLLGTTYGGDGVTTFALPDLRGRAPLHFGQGPGLSDYMQGEASGTETVTLTTAQMPAHNHAIACNSATGTSRTPGGNILAAVVGNSPSGPYTDSEADGALSPAAVFAAGSNQPTSVMQPYLVMNYIIALEGIYPSRS